MVDGRQFLRNGGERGFEKKSFLEAVQDAKSMEQCLTEEHAWPYLYHLSNIRENILDWYDFGADASLLEIGAECGALTGLFCRKVRRVVAVEPSKECVEVNSKRNAAYHNLTIVSDDFKDFETTEKFDYVTMIGVFAYAPYYFDGEDPFMDMLQKMKSFLKPDGKLILAIQNKYGLKYFAGAAEDHTSRCFDGLENYADAGPARTFSRKALVKMLETAGFLENQFYYPMPDYRLPSEIYSDKNLPSFGSIREACVSYDRDRYELFDERLAYDSICEDGMFQDFANSFLVISSMESNTLENGDAESGAADKSYGTIVEYAKYNRLRAPQFQLRTRIFCNRQGQKYAEKAALCAQAQAHVERLSENYQKLAGANILIPVRFLSNADGKAFFPYIKGRSLAKKVNQCLWEKEKFFTAMQEALDCIYGAPLQNPDNLVEFKVTDQFRQIFGAIDDTQSQALQGMKSFRVSNVDSILSNFIEQPDGRLMCLDYEWVFEFPIPVDYLIYRTVFYYLSENCAYISPCIPEQEYLDRFGLTEEKAAVFAQMENHFQQYVHGEDYKYDYTSNYQKKAVNIGKNLQRNESWFLSIMDDVHRLNHELGEYRRDLVVCKVKMHRKSEFLERYINVLKNPVKIKKWFQKKRY